MMKLRLFAICVGLTGSLLAVPALAQTGNKPAAETMAPGTVLISGPAGQVTLAEVRMLVDEQVPPSRQPAFWASPKSISEAARNLYGYRALAQQALKADAWPPHVIALTKRMTSVRRLLFITRMVSGIEVWLQRPPGNAMTASR